MLIATQQQEHNHLFLYEMIGKLERTLHVSTALQTGTKHKPRKQWEQQ